MGKNLLVIAQETEGYESVTKMLLDATMGVQCPAVCKKCQFVDIDVDPDTENACCEECGELGLSSVLVLAGLI